MALLTFLQDPSPSSRDPKLAGSCKKQDDHRGQPQRRHQQHPSASSSSWDQFKNLLSCKDLELSAKVHDPSRAGRGGNAYLMLGSSCNSICNSKDVVVHGNTRVTHQPDNSPEGSMAGQKVGLLKKKSGHGRSSSSRSLPSSSSHAHDSSLQFRKLSGCYECHKIVDPSRYPYNPRSTICSCSKCREIFREVESLELLHQAVRHAGTRGVPLTARSSFAFTAPPLLAPSAPMDPPASAAWSAAAPAPLSGTASRVNQGHGDSSRSKGVWTTASSGCAHDLLSCSDGRRGMLVCRVIAGKVKLDDTPIAEDGMASSCYDLVAGHPGMYVNLEDLNCSIRRLHSPVLW